MLRPVRTTWIGACLVAGCALTAPRPFAPPVPQVESANQQRGDPHAGRFSYEDAVAGLPEGPVLRAVIDTEAGEIHCRLDPGTAPIAVASFVGLARALRVYVGSDAGPWELGHFFDGLPFHRAVERQFVQTGRRGIENAGFFLQDEMSSGHVFDRGGLMALANAGTPHSSSAQFFITTEPLPQLNGKHTIFGACDDEDVVRELERRTLASPDAPPKLRRVTITRGP